MIYNDIREYLYDFVKFYEKFYKNGDPYKHLPLNSDLELIEEWLENNTLTFSKETI